MYIWVGGLRKHHSHYHLDIEATSILKNRPSKQAGGLPESLDKMHELSAGKFPGPSMMFPGGAGGVLDGASTATEMDESAFSIPNIAPYLVFNPQIILYSSQPASKRWVLQAIMQSIREVSFSHCRIIINPILISFSLSLGIRLLNLLLNARWPLQLFLHVNLSPKIWQWNPMKTRCVKRLIGWLRI